MKILLIEDDELVAHRLIKALTAQKYSIDIAADGQEGWELVESFSYDLIVSDIILPKLDGISFCQRLRSQGIRTPVILLTAQDSSTKKVMGLDAGADDYMTKPFDLQELLARIRALLRRGSSSLPPILKWGDLHLNPGTMEVVYQDKPLHLTPKEYSLLELFLRHPHRVFSRSTILDRLWSFEESPGEETVTAHIKGLRMKLKAAGLTKAPIETVYGIGYRLKANEPEHNTKKKKSKKQKRLLPDARQKAIAVATSIWQQAQTKFSSRVAAIEKATTAMLKDSLNEELRQLATSEAHKLAGSMGMFNFDRGSHLAREIEQLFSARKPLSPQQRQHLSELVVAIRQELEKANTVECPNLLCESDSVAVSEERPLLLIVEKNGSVAQELIPEAANWGMGVVVAADPTTARDLIWRETPEVILLAWEQADSAENNLKLLEELNASRSPVPVIVLAEGDSLLDRVKIARLGGSGFLRKPLTPAQILEAVSQVWHRTHRVEAKVTIVDDDPQLLTCVKNFLEPWGLQVFTLDNPLKFWETLEATSPDLLILDVEMPSVSGIELCQVVRNDLRWSGLPVLFLTAHTDAQTKHRVFAVGADDYVSKPVVGAELVTRILNRLERSRLLKKLAETDPLTGVANRHKSIQELTKLLQIAARQNQPCCFAILKLEDLKQINEQYGHAFSDRILSKLGQLLRQNFYDEDVVSRWAGAEFVLGMYGMTKEHGAIGLSELLEDLRREEFTAKDGTQVQVNFTTGIVEYPADGTDWQRLYRSAKALLI